MAKKSKDVAEAAPAKDKKKLVIIAVVVLAAGFAYMKMGKAAPEAAAAAPPTVVEAVEGEIAEVGQMTVNLSSPELHYARVTFSVVLDQTATADKVSPRFPLLKDAALTEIARSSYDALRTPEGVDDLRARLTARAHELYPAEPPAPSPIVRVVLTELVVQ